MSKSKRMNLQRVKSMKWYKMRSESNSKSRNEEPHGAKYFRKQTFLVPQSWRETTQKAEAQTYMVSGWVREEPNHHSSPSGAGSPSNRAKEILFLVNTCWKWPGSVGKLTFELMLLHKTPPDSNLSRMRKIVSKQKSLKTLPKVLQHSKPIVQICIKAPKLVHM